MKHNRHSHAVPPAVLQAALAKMDEVRGMLAPYMTPLTPAERHKLLKMGGRAAVFVEEAYAFARENPVLVPPFLDMDAFGEDFSDAHGLWTLASSARQVVEGIDDTAMTAGSEAYQAALMFYQMAKRAAALIEYLSMI